MQKIIFISTGVVILASGFLLAKRFSSRANRSGIGSFTLLPIAGIVYMAGILLCILGALTILFGLAL